MTAKIEQNALLDPHCLTIMGVDPALNHVAYSILQANKETLELMRVTYGMYNIDKDDAMEQKLVRSFSRTQELISAFQVNEFVLEKAFHNPKRPSGAVAVREALGAIKVGAAMLGVPIFMFTPQQIKKSVTGSGKAEKLDVAKHVSDILGITHFCVNRRLKRKNEQALWTPEELIKKKFDHISDAIAISLCRLHEIQSKGVREVC